MADIEIDPAIIKATQEALGKYVRKPPLTEKLLKKPPFRFLYDVFSAVIKETHCFEGLYTQDELKFENIKDRDDKMRFLQKMIDVIKLITNSELKVKASKIVAGHEADKTNELLRLMGFVIGEKLDWHNAVEQVTGGAALKPVTKPKLSKEKSKETTTKAAAGKGKSISPTTNDSERPKRLRDKSITPTAAVTEQKPKRISPDKEKPKLGKPTKTDMERAVIKKTKKDGKPTKSKPETEKQKSPSPVKAEKKSKKVPPQAETVPNEPNIESKVSTEEGTSLMKVRDSAVKASPPPTSQSPPKPNAEVIARRNSQQAEPAQSNEVEAQKEASSRKSSAQRKSSASSGKGRRLSVQENEGSLTPPTAASNSQLESLQGSNEAVKSAAVKPQAINGADTAVPLPAPTQLPQEQERHIEPQQMSTEMKRETTFTRENSKDSANNQRPRTSLRPPSARPPSARPGAPRHRDRNVEIVLQPNDQVKMSGINVKLESFGDLDDDGENLVIIEDVNAHDINDENGSGLGGDEVTAQLAAEQMAQQGHLVQQILETQKELVQQNNNDGNATNKDENMTGHGMRQSSARQMNGLRDIIQNLTKSVNPFGKLMDFIPEDIDAMQLELSMWRDAYTQAASELKRERNLTESATEPMKQQLIQIEANIREYHEMIDASRTKILHNNARIIKMLMEQ